MNEGNAIRAIGFFPAGMINGALEILEVRVCVRSVAMGEGFVVQFDERLERVLSAGEKSGIAKVIQRLRTDMIEPLDSSATPLENAIVEVAAGHASDESLRKHGELMGRTMRTLGVLLLRTRKSIRAAMLILDRNPSGSVVEHQINMEQVPAEVKAVVLMPNTSAIITGGHSGSEIDLFLNVPLLETARRIQVVSD